MSENKDTNKIEENKDMSKTGEKKAIGREKETTAQNDTSVKQNQYSPEEFMKNAKVLFDCQPECVKAAFRMAGSTEATEEEAKKIVAAFLKKGVN